MYWCCRCYHLLGRRVDSCLVRRKRWRSAARMRIVSSHSSQTQVESKVQVREGRGRAQVQPSYCLISSIQISILMFRDFAAHQFWLCKAMMFFYAWFSSGDDECSRFGDAASWTPDGGSGSILACRYEVLSNQIRLHVLEIFVWVPQNSCWWPLGSLNICAALYEYEACIASELRLALWLVCLAWWLRFVECGAIYDTLPVHVLWADDGGVLWIGRFVSCIVASCMNPFLESLSLHCIKRLTLLSMCDEV